MVGEIKATIECMIIKVETCLEYTGDYHTINDCLRSQRCEREDTDSVQIHSFAFQKLALRSH